MTKILVIFVRLGVAVMMEERVRIRGEEEF
jgi:hypothetical protein